MTSATERTDDDVIVITDAQVVGSSQTDADETPGSAEHELPDDTDLQAGDSDLNSDDERLDDDEPDDDELGASGERGDHLTTSGDVTADSDGPSGSSAFAMPAGDSTADSSADSTASAGAGSFATPTEEPDGSLADPDSSLADPDGSLAEPLAADASATDPLPASTSPAVASSASQADNSNWPEIQSMFVDDPRSAVERAAEVTGAALAGLVAAAQEREQSLRSDWEADGTGTEELRTSLQHYRELATRLTGLSQEL